MIRVVLALLLAAPAAASVTRPGPLRLPRELRPAVVEPRPELEPGQLLITPATKVYLDGKRVKIADIPDGCEVTELAVDAAGNVLVVRFKRK